MVSKLDHSPSQIIGKSLTDQGTNLLPGVTLRKRAQTGSFTPNAADGLPRVGMTDDIVNLLCHFIGKKMISRFGNVMFIIEIVKQNMSILLTWILDTHKQKHPTYISSQENDDLLISSVCSDSRLRG